MFESLKTEIRFEASLSGFLDLSLFHLYREVAQAHQQELLRAVAKRTLSSHCNLLCFLPED